MLMTSEPSAGSREVSKTAASATEYLVKLQCADDSWVTAMGSNPQCTTSPAFPQGGYCSGACGVLQLIDLNGGDLEDLDTVRVKWLEIHGSSYFTAKVGEDRLGWWYGTGTYSDEFELETLDCDHCSVSEGGRISLLSTLLDTFWSAENGGSDYISVDATTRGSWESFELVIVSGPS